MRMVSAYCTNAGTPSAHESPGDMGGTGCLVIGQRGPMGLLSKRIFTDACQSDFLSQVPEEYQEAADKPLLNSPSEKLGTEEEALEHGAGTQQVEDKEEGPVRPFVADKDLGMSACRALKSWEQQLPLQAAEGPTFTEAVAGRGAPTREDVGDLARDGPSPASSEQNHVGTQFTRDHGESLSTPEGSPKTSISGSMQDTEVQDRQAQGAGPADAVALKADEDAVSLGGPSRGGYLDERSAAAAGQPAAEEALRIHSPLGSDVKGLPEEGSLAGSRRAFDEATWASKPPDVAINSSADGPPASQPELSGPPEEDYLQEASASAQTAGGSEMDETGAAEDSGEPSGPSYSPQGCAMLDRQGSSGVLQQDRTGTQGHPSSDVPGVPPSVHSSIPPGPQPVESGHSSAYALLREEISLPQTFGCTVSQTPKHPVSPVPLKGGPAESQERDLILEASASVDNNAEQPPYAQVSDGVSEHGDSVPSPARVEAPSSCERTSDSLVVGCESSSPGVSWGLPEKAGSSENRCYAETPEVGLELIREGKSPSFSSPMGEAAVTQEGLAGAQAEVEPLLVSGAPLDDAEEEQNGHRASVSLAAESLGEPPHLPRDEALDPTMDEPPGAHPSPQRGLSIGFNDGQAQPNQSLFFPSEVAANDGELPSPRELVAADEGTCVEPTEQTDAEVVQVIRSPSPEDVLVPLGGGLQKSSGARSDSASVGEPEATLGPPAPEQTPEAARGGQGPGEPPIMPEAAVQRCEPASEPSKAICSPGAQALGYLGSLKSQEDLQRPEASYAPAKCGADLLDDQPQSLSCCPCQVEGGNRQDAAAAPEDAPGVPEEAELLQPSAFADDASEDRSAVSALEAREASIFPEEAPAHTQAEIPAAAETRTPLGGVLPVAATSDRDNSREEFLLTRASDSPRTAGEDLAAETPAEVPSDTADAGRAADVELQSKRSNDSVVAEQGGEDVPPESSLGAFLALPAPVQGLPADVESEACVVAVRDSLTKARVPAVPHGETAADCSDTLLPLEDFATESAAPIKSPFDSPDAGACLLEQPILAPSAETPGEAEDTGRSRLALKQTREAQGDLIGAADSGYPLEGEQSKETGDVERPLSSAAIERQDPLLTEGSRCPEQEEQMETASGLPQLELPTESSQEGGKPVSDETPMTAEELDAGEQAPPSVVPRGLSAVSSDDAAEKPHSATLLEARELVSQSQAETVSCRFISAEAEGPSPASGGGPCPLHFSKGPISRVVPAELLEPVALDDTARPEDAAGFGGDTEPLIAHSSAEPPETTHARGVGEQLRTVSPEGTVCLRDGQVSAQEPLDMHASQDRRPSLGSESLGSTAFIALRQPAEPHQPTASPAPMIVEESLGTPAVMKLEASLTHQAPVGCQASIAADESLMLQTALGRNADEHHDCQSPEGAVLHQKEGDSKSSLVLQEPIYPQETPGPQVSLNAQTPMDSQSSLGPDEPPTHQMLLHSQESLGSQEPAGPQEQARSQEPIRPQASAASLSFHAHWHPEGSLGTQQPGGPQGPMVPAALQTTLRCEHFRGPKEAADPEGSLGCPASSVHSQAPMEHQPSKGPEAPTSSHESPAAEGSLGLQDSPEPPTPLGMDACSQVPLGFEKSVSLPAPTGADEPPGHEECFDHQPPPYQQLAPSSHESRASQASVGQEAPSTAKKAHAPEGSLGSQTSLRSRASLHSQTSLDLQEPGGPQESIGAAGSMGSQNPIESLEVHESDRIADPTEGPHTPSPEDLVSVIKGDGQRFAAAKARATVTGLLDSLAALVASSCRPTGPDSSHPQRHPPASSADGPRGTKGSGTEPGPLPPPVAPDGCTLTSATDAGESGKVPEGENAPLERPLGSESGGWSPPAPGEGAEQTTNITCPATAERRTSRCAEGGPTGVLSGTTKARASNADAGRPPEGKSSWRMAKVANIPGRPPSPAPRLSGALDSLASRRSSSQREEEPIMIENLAVFHAPITAPQPAPRPAAHVVGMSISSGSQDHAASRHPPPMGGTTRDPPGDTQTNLNALPNTQGLVDVLEKQGAAREPDQAQRVPHEPDAAGNEVDRTTSVLYGAPAGLGVAALLQSPLATGNAASEGLRTPPIERKSPYVAQVPTVPLPLHSLVGSLPIGAPAVRPPPRGVLQSRPPPSYGGPRPRPPLGSQGEGIDSIVSNPAVVRTGPPASAPTPPTSGTSSQGLQTTALRALATTQVPVYPCGRPAAAVASTPLQCPPPYALAGAPQKTATKPLTSEAAGLIGRPMLPEAFGVPASPANIAGRDSAMPRMPYSGSPPAAWRPPPASSARPAAQLPIRPAPASRPSLRGSINALFRPVSPDALMRPATPGATPDASTATLATPASYAGTMTRSPARPPVMTAEAQPPSDAPPHRAIRAVQRPLPPPALRRPARPGTPTYSLAMPLYEPSSRETAVPEKPLLLPPTKVPSRPEPSDDAIAGPPCFQRPPLATAIPGVVLERPMATTPQWSPPAVGTKPQGAPAQPVAANKQPPAPPQGGGPAPTAMLQAPPLNHTRWLGAARQPGAPTQARPTVPVSRPLRPPPDAHPGTAPQEAPNLSLPSAAARASQRPAPAEGFGRPAAAGTSLAVPQLPSSIAAPAAWRPASPTPLIMMAATQFQNSAYPPGSVMSMQRISPPAGCSRPVTAGMSPNCEAMHLLPFHQVPQKHGSLSPLPPPPASAGVSPISSHPTSEVPPSVPLEKTYTPVLNDTLSRPVAPGEPIASSTAPRLPWLSASPGMRRPPAVSPMKKVPGSERPARPTAPQCLPQTVMTAATQPLPGAPHPIAKQAVRRPLPPIDSNTTARPGLATGSDASTVLPSVRAVPVPTIPSLMPSASATGRLTSPRAPQAGRLPWPLPATPSRPLLPQSGRPPGQPEEP